MFKKRQTSKKENEITVNIDPVRLVAAILTVLMCVFSFFSLVKIVSSFFGVSRFEMVDRSEVNVYEASDLAAGAGLKRGDKLFLINKETAEKELLKNCAYLKKASVKKVFPNKVRFVVECHVPVWYTEISGDYYVLDANLNVLEECSSEKPLTDMGLIKLTLPRIKRAVVNETLIFGDGNEEVEQTKKIMQTILSSASLGMICGADIDNRYAINFEFDKVVQDNASTYIDVAEHFKVNVGGYSKLDVKLEYIMKALINEDLEGVVGGSIDVSDNGSKVSIRPYFSPTVPDDEEDENGKEDETTDGESDIVLPPQNQTPGVAG